jgi:serine phosphatase RsbU (regulator of sigma subunit)
MVCTLDISVRSNPFILCAGRGSLKRSVLSILLVFWVFSGYAQPTEAEYEQAFARAVQRKDAEGALQNSLALGELHLSTSHYTKAETWFLQAIKYSSQLKDNNNLYLANQGLGLAYFNQKNYTKASASFEKSIAAAKLGNNKAYEASGYFNMAEAEKSARRYKRAIPPLEKVLSLALESGNESLQMDCYMRLSLCYELLGNSAQANVYRNLHQQLGGSQKRLEDHEQTLSYLKHEVSQARSEQEVTRSILKQQEERIRKTEDSLHTIEALSQARQLQIDLLEKEKELSELRIREQNAALQHDKVLRNSMIAGLLLSALLLTVMIVNYRYRMQASRKIHEQNENIKGSIKYAKRIQEAMLPKEQKLSDLLPESFVLFKPRDTVSGDFYWFNEIQNGHTGKDLAFAVVDCTGHGVPGAFMSMIGMNSLNSIVSRGTKHTDEILLRLHEEIRTALKQEENGNDDGMDMALCIYRKALRKIEFSGAKNPLVYIQDQQLFQVKGDVHPIGGSRTKPGLVFKKHEITIDKPTMLYLFSDGYKDQFGGKENTKFMARKFNELLLRIHHLPLSEQRIILERTIEEWKGGHAQTDDILVLGIKLGVN